MKNYKIATLGIAYDHFDDESIIVNIPKGNYYSVRSIAHGLFKQLTVGSNVELLSEYVNQRYENVPANLSEAINTFVEQLQREELLLETDEIQPQEEAVPISKQPFSLPVLEIYDDMQELLLLDPVHEVQPTEGWPLKK
jgi:hypothetical protein